MSKCEHWRRLVREMGLLLSHTSPSCVYKIEINKSRQKPPNFVLYFSSISFCVMHTRFGHVTTPVHSNLRIRSKKIGKRI